MFARVREGLQCFWLPEKQSFTTGRRGSTPATRRQPDPLSQMAWLPVIAACVPRGPTGQVRFEKRLGVIA
jgi:hypothetical protein